MSFYNSANKKAVENSERAYTTADHESKRISIGIAFNTDGPKLESMQKVNICATQGKNHTYPTTQNRTNTSSQTHDTLSNSIGKANSVWRCHWKRLEDVFRQLQVIDQLTIVQQNRDGRITKGTTTETQCTTGRI